jgi:hypothetical protein
MATCNVVWRLGYLGYLGSGAGHTRTQHLAILLALAILLGALASWRLDAGAGQTRGYLALHLGYLGILLGYLALLGHLGAGAG